MVQHSARQGFAPVSAFSPHALADIEEPARNPRSALAGVGLRGIRFRRSLFLARGFLGTLAGLLRDRAAQLREGLLEARVLRRLDVEERAFQLALQSLVDLLVGDF